MALRWLDAHDGSPAMTCLDGDRLVGQVAFYDMAAGEGPGWRGYVLGMPVGGRCSTAEEARAEVERASEGRGRLR